MDRPMSSNSIESLVLCPTDAGYPEGCSMEILAGFLIALAIGVTGLGAGSITAPILILFFQQSATDAVTTALVFGTVVKLIATPIYLSRGHVNFRVLKFMVLG